MLQKLLSSLTLFAVFFSPIETTGQAAAYTLPTIPLHQFTLHNGLRIILSEDHTAPVVSICVTYDVGSRSEVPGRTGFAHLFEHMMYQGSANVGKGEHFLLIKENGGKMNGATSEDITQYFETLPANQIDLGLFLEGDRMQSLDITQANLDNQRQAVQEERRLRVDNTASGKTNEAIGNTVYDNFAYKHSTIGSMADLNAATVADVAQFFKKYYSPSNAVLTVVGDFDQATIKSKIDRYFGAISPQPVPAQPDLTEPVQQSERVVEVKEPLATLPNLSIFFKGPPGDSREWYALQAAIEILAGGKSSRLFQELGERQGLIDNIRGGIDKRRGPSLVALEISPKIGGDFGLIRAAIGHQVEQLQHNGIEGWELKKYQLESLDSLASRRSSSLARAVLIGKYAVDYKNPELVNTELEDAEKVTSAEILNAARKYLVPTNRTVIISLPTKADAVQRSVDGEKH